MNNTKTVVLICCPDRSGSTMLDAILGNGRDCFSTGEIHAYFRPWKRNHLMPRCACGRPGCAQWRGIESVTEGLLHQFLFSKHNVQFLIDSSKSPEWVFDMNRYALEGGFKVFNLLLYKNPVDLAFSYYKRGDWMLGLQKFSWYYARFFSTGLPYITIGYDDIVAAPDESVKKICNLIGMKYWPGKENFTDSGDLHHLFGSAGIRQQSGKTTKFKKNNFTQEFESLLPVIESAISQNKNIGKVLLLLEATKFKEVEPASLMLPPLWYLKKKIVRKLKYTLSFGNKSVWIKSQGTKR